MLKVKLVTRWNSISSVDQPKYKNFSSSLNLHHQGERSLAFPKQPNALLIHHSTQQVLKLGTLHKSPLFFSLYYKGRHEVTRTVKRNVTRNVFHHHNFLLNVKCLFVVPVHDLERNSTCVSKWHWKTSR